MRKVYIRFDILHIALFLAAAMVWRPAFAQTDVLEATVFIQCKNNDTQETSAGTGVVVSDVGHVLSVKHVLVGSPERNRCFAQFGTASSSPDREIIRLDIVEGYDAAVFQFPIRTGETFKPLIYAPLDASMVGKTASVAGFPGGDSISPVINASVIGSVTLESSGTFPTGGRTSQGMSGGPFTFEGKLIGLVNGGTSNSIGENESYDILAIEPFYDQVQAYFEGEGADVKKGVLDEMLIADDFCSRLFREHLEHRKSRFEEETLLGALFSGDEEPPTSDLADKAEYWVTITTGPAYWANCNSPGTTRKSLYFPLGMMLRLERDIVVGEETYSVFQTEHGLRVMIEPSAVAPVTEDSGYVFATNLASFQLCIPGRECDASQERSIIPRNYIPPQIPLSEPILRPHESYLLVRNDVSELDMAYEAWNNLLDSNVMPTALDQDPACRLRKAKFYHFFDKYDESNPDYPAEGQFGSQYRSNVNYTLCSTTPNGQIIPRSHIKIVTPTIAHARFDNLWSVDAVREMPDHIKNATSVLLDYKKTLKNKFGCSESREEYNTLGGALKKFVEIKPPFQGDLDPRNLNNVLARNEAAIAADKAARAVLSIYRQYQSSPGRNRTQIIGQTPLFADIEIAIYCYENQVNTHNDGLIRIDLGPLWRDAPLELRIADLYNRYRDFHENAGLGSNAVVNKNLNEGVVFRICEYAQYAKWVEVLTEELDDSEAMVSAASRLGFNDDHYVMVDHMVQLVLASAFSTHVQLRDKRNNGTCKKRRR